VTPEVTFITVVSFVNTGTAATLYFCGHQENLFPVNETVRVDYTQGILCSLLVRVVIINVSEQTAEFLAPENNVVTAIFAVQ
jgi:hypothetical protein